MPRWCACALGWRPNALGDGHGLSFMILVGAMIMVCIGTIMCAYILRAYSNDSMGESTPNSALDSSPAACISQKPQQPVWVMESPPPTRLPSSPWPTTPSIARRRRALWRGGSRKGSHTRNVTVYHNPRKPHQCGYEAVLRASGMTTSTKAIKRLRRKTANLVEEWYEEKQVIHGIDIVSAIDQTGFNITTYKSHICGRQWASCVELVAALRVCQASAVLKIKSFECLEGDDLSTHFIIQLRNTHYVLLKSRSDFMGEVMAAAPVNIRGGMHQQHWHWEEQVMGEPQPPPDALPSTALAATQQEELQLPVNHSSASLQPQDVAYPVEVQIEAAHAASQQDELPDDLPDWALPSHLQRSSSSVRILVHDSLKSDIIELQLCYHLPASVGFIRQRLARIFTLPPERVVMTSSASPKQRISDIAIIPDELMVLDELMYKGGPYLLITFFDPDNAVDFDVRLKTSETNEKVVEKISKIMAIPQQEVRLVHPLGHAWCFPQSAHDTTLVHVLRDRGGVRTDASRSRSRSQSRSQRGRGMEVSATLPFQPDHLEVGHHLNSPPQSAVSDQDSWDQWDEMS